MKPTAADEWCAYVLAHGLSEADFTAGLELMRRRYEEGRDGTRQRVSVHFADVLAGLRSGAVAPLDAAAFGKLLRILAIG